MSEYEIGYKKPPVSTRFKKGESGNKKGRPNKKSLTSLDYLSMALEKKVVVNEKNGTSYVISRLQALWESALAHAMRGDKGCLSLLIKQLPLLDQKVVEQEQKQSLITIEDKQCLRNALDRRSIGLLRKYGYEIPEELSKLEGN